MSYFENIQKQYQAKLTTADEAAKIVKSGDWVEYLFGLNSAPDFDQALAKRVNELDDVNIRLDLGVFPKYTLDADPSGEHFYWNSWHYTATDRRYSEKRQLSYLPMKFSENPQMTRGNKINVFVLGTTPMDKHGYFNFGMSSSNAWAAIETADVVIVEVRDTMPRALGGGQECISIRDVDHVFEGTHRVLPALPVVEPNAVETAIAGHVVERLVDGCCIQLGIGGVPNAVGTMIAKSDLKNLGVHTEMYVDAYMYMDLAGKINGACKEINKYKQVYSFALGCADLYEFIDDNPNLASYSVDYTNSPCVVQQLSNMVSINACIEVDLYGQVSSESVGSKHISGTGGQLDFVEGAYHSKGGQSFICMNATKTDKAGNVTSNIKANLTPGSIVTDPRTATHMVVTEFGVANMKGKSTWERAEALIKIAHPQFQDQLVEEAEKNLVFKPWRKGKF